MAYLPKTYAKNKKTDQNSQFICQVNIFCRLHAANGKIKMVFVSVLGEFVS